MYELVIRGGTVATAADVVKCDVAVSGGTIVALGRDLPKGDHEIDASGRLVLPGGVDSHCHIEQLGSSGGYNADTWTSGTTSAACGGTTTVICFSPTTKGATVKAEAEAYHALAKKAVIDYSFHIIVNDANERVLAELPGLIETGHRSIKMFMTYDNNFVDDAILLKVFAVAREHGAFVTIHAENHEAIKWMTKRLVETGHTAMKYHAWSKPPVVEREATHRVIALAEIMDQPIQIFHVTCQESAEEIHRAQQRGLKIFGETCIQYLDSHRQRHGPARLRGREVHLQSFAAHRGGSGGVVELPAHRRARGRLVRPRPIPLRRSEGQADERYGRAVQQGPEWPARESRRACRCCSRKAS